jgi:hypothetical protein
MSFSVPPPWRSLGRTFRNEAEFATWVFGQLDPYFVIRREVEGTSCLGSRMRIDAVLRPRDATGWADPDPAFGVELKNPNAGYSTKDHTKWVAQAVDYTHTSWDGYGRLLIATCPPVTQEVPGGLSAEWMLVRIVGQLGIGELGISRSQGWALRVSGERVWSQDSGPRRNWSVKPKQGSR